MVPMYQQHATPKAAHSPLLQCRRGIEVRATLHDGQRTKPLLLQMAKGKHPPRRDLIDQDKVKNGRFYIDMF